jgi:PleD family two-component response regulator
MGCVAAHEFDIGESVLRVTASFGVCTRLGDSLEAMLKVADVLLYKAKREGRDRVVVDEREGEGDSLDAGVVP